ncbi:MAG: decarboxylating 6-phosphogluconate dehydrogenase [Acholeplasmatales bacterium]|nr:MAG: decarboxylating 6-phosphogluconate dehydrogenase [Acholeplasmatales bacterium]
MKKIGMIGLGKMGYNLALNLIDHGVEVHGYDTAFSEAVAQTASLRRHDTIETLIASLSAPRIIWLMIPAGNPVDAMLETLSSSLERGDIVIDGGNSRYLDTMARAERLKQHGIALVDCGTSGGTEGARHGASLMVGGEAAALSHCAWVFESLAAKDGYAHLGPSGSGHFVKMVHNGIEYGMMQALGEGYELLEASPFALDYQAVSRVWSNGSIIEGLLMRMVVAAFDKDPRLESLAGRVDESGEGRWTVEAAVNLKVAAPVITQALYSRFKSKDTDKFAEKLVAAMRNEFGGHAVYKK